MFASVLGSHLLAPPHDAFSSTRLKYSATTLVKTEEMRRQEVHTVMEEISATDGAWKHEESVQSDTAVLHRETQSQRETSVSQDKIEKTPSISISTEARKPDGSITGEKDRKVEERQKKPAAEYETISSKKVAETKKDVHILAEKVSVQKVELKEEKREESIESKVMTKQKSSRKPEVTTSSELTPEPVKDVPTKVIQQGAISLVKAEGRETGQILEDEGKVLAVPESEQKRIFSQKEIKGTKKSLTSLSSPCLTTRGQHSIS